MIAYKGEIGRAISQTTGLDFTGATARQVKLRKPSGAVLTKIDSAVIVDDAPTGQIHILSIAGDLDQTGEYLMQAKITIGSVILFGPVTSFDVEDVLV